MAFVLDARQPSRLSSEVVGLPGDDFLQARTRAIHHVAQVTHHTEIQAPLVG